MIFYSWAVYFRYHTIVLLILWGNKMIIFQNPIDWIVMCYLVNKGHSALCGCYSTSALCWKNLCTHTYWFSSSQWLLQTADRQPSEIIWHNSVLVTQLLLFSLTAILLFLCSTCLRTVAWRTYSVTWSTRSSPCGSPRSWKVSNPQSQPAVSYHVFLICLWSPQIDQIENRSLSLSL